MDKLLNVSASPHVRDKTTTSQIMLDVIIALLPATLFGIYNFGLNAALIIAVTVATCVLSEFLFEYFLKKPMTIKDFSAVVTGMILALNLPASVPLWLPVIGGVFAIIVVKQLYGGLGQNFMNPALAARCFLLISFTGRMTNFVYDGVASATPLAIIKSGGNYDLLSMFIGNIGGTIGETSVIALLLGAAYLVIRHVIKLTIPLTYILTFTLFTLVFSPQPFNLYYLGCQLCGGGLIFGAFFMATDYVTSPITRNGQIIYGIIIGILTGLFRFFGTSAEGVSYAIIISNLLVPIIEKFTLPVPFGKAGVKHE
ncbi:RnfABCDGE type electron transport complex subunit D [[Clostridium] spiroforme]|nr:RnfABCDGE type electron transport complex subunit D [Thomasclavelia spiroformis]MBM6880675.1 RnfABCDGE type electron transport complex subunit D [Thomasclavelia spiroformis]MBM6930773.1 RnfABCDGE type electron transport complex subunit D [Thomasclavelia spiroformis]